MNSQSFKTFTEKIPSRSRHLYQQDLPNISIMIPILNYSREKEETTLQLILGIITLY